MWYVKRFSLCLYAYYIRFINQLIHCIHLINHGNGLPMLENQRIPEGIWKSKCGLTPQRCPWTHRCWPVFSPCLLLIPLLPEDIPHGFQAMPFFHQSQIVDMANLRWYKYLPNTSRALYIQTESMANHFFRPVSCRQHHLAQLGAGDPRMAAALLGGTAAGPTFDLPGLPALDEFIQDLAGWELQKLASLGCSSRVFLAKSRDGQTNWPLVSESTCHMSTNIIQTAGYFMWGPSEGPFNLI